MKQIKLISNFKARTYQQSIFANSVNKNSLVVLPTGMGKTIVAIMLAVYYFNQTNKKILFLAPTKPLVEQQEKSFKDFFVNSDDFNFQVLTGLVAPKKREIMYKENDFIFSTPQLIENDIVNRIVDPKDFCLVIFDEAHRATGNYAYCFTAEQFANHSNILALTASPGADKDVITEVIDNLRIEHLEVKRSTDRDVKPYVKEVEIDKIQVELTPELEKIKLLFDTCFAKRLELLKDLGFLDNKKSNQITKTNLLELQSYLRTQITQGDADDNIWQAISIAAGLMKLQYGQELFESQELSAAYIYFYNFFRPGGDKSKAAEALTQDVDFREGFEALSKLNKEGVQHPKLIKLKEIVNKEVLANKNLKIIIFNQYRDSAEKIVKELEKIKEIKPALFVGQAKKGEIKLSQKEQKQILQDFREDKYNIIVSTSVGEEGLDIPKVDLVIFYEPIPSAIRSIQRIGRTGRFRKGYAKILITKGTRDIIVSHISNAKERKMYRVLDELKNKFEGANPNVKSKEKGLTKFFEAKNIVNKEEIKIEEKVNDTNEINKVSKDNDEYKYQIYIDNRENNDLLKELFNIEDLRVEAKKLDVADIVITEKIAIERKAKVDFVNSIIDKRLFPQLIDLAKNYQRPILILEGEQNIFSIRNLNPNVIRATLSAIAVDLRIPIIYTNNLNDTANMILTITKRAQKEKKEISLVAEKSSISENQELEKFVSSIPKINVSNAKKLLSYFKSIKNLINAKEDKLQEVDGIGKGRAKNLKNFFLREYK